MWGGMYGKRIYDIVKMIGLDLRLSLICRFSHLSLTHHPSPVLSLVSSSDYIYLFVAIVAKSMAANEHTTDYMVLDMFVMCAVQCVCAANIVLHSFHTTSGRHCSLL